MVKLESVHGGHNRKAVGSRGLGYAEEVLVDELAKMVAARLTGCRYIPQDSGNRDQNLAYLVREMDKKRGVNLSIHFNAFGDSSAHGTECYSYRGDATGKSLSTKMSADIAKVLGTTNRGAKHAPLYVIDRSIDTTLLVEICFITNKKDMDAYVKNKAKVADAIAKCFDNYKGVNAPITPPSSNQKDWSKQYYTTNPGKVELLKVDGLYGINDINFKNGKVTPNYPKGTPFVITGLKHMANGLPRLITQSGHLLSANKAIVQQVVASKPKLTNQQVAVKVYRGEYGNDPQRSQKLRSEGYNPSAIQALVNKM